MKSIPVLVGHRGASHLAPENTLPSYRLAFQEGADRIEGDFWMTSDGEIVCIHDPSTSRTAPGQPAIDVRDVTYDDLKAYDVGLWKSEDYKGTRIPTLEEILRELPPETGIYIEIKQDDPAMVSKMLAAAENCHVPLSRLTLISFSAAIVKQTKELAPQLTAYLLHEFENLGETGADENYLQGIINTAVSIGADGIDIENSPIVDRPFVEKMRKAGLEFHVWTVNTIEDAMRFMDLGADSITTDRPGDLRKEIEAITEQ